MRTSQSKTPPGGQPARRRLRPARRHRLGRGPRSPPDRGARGAAEPPRHARRAGRAHGSSRDAGAAGAAPAVDAAAAERVAAAAARARVLQRPRRLRRGRARVRDDPRRGAVDAGAVDQRDRQRTLRLPGLRVRRRLHLVGQQPREPAHAVVERSGLRSARRGDLRARRGERRGLGADRAPDPRGARDLRRAPRPGLQPLRAHLARHRARAAAVRPARRPGQDLAADAREPLRPDAPAVA